MPDPRSAKGRRHPLPAILTLAVAAMLSGARSIYAIYQWGRLQESEVLHALGFTRDKTPSVSTLDLVFRALDVDAFESLLGDWAKGHLGDRAEAIAIDGKGLRGLHGRSMPIATGLKVANPAIKVIAAGGDGDAFAIGAGHTVHAIRRNVDICYVIMDNAVYGLTKGQTSPTSQLGFTTKTTPRGNVDQPINPLLLALACGATFVARGFSGRPKELAEIIERGMKHKGFAFIDTYSPCPTFNKTNTFKFYREEVEELPADHDVTNKVEAMRLASLDDPLYLGVFYQVELPTFVDHIEAQQSGTEADRPQLINSLFSHFS